MKILNRRELKSHLELDFKAFVDAGLFLLENSRADEIPGSLGPFNSEPIC
jgi:hypothetical protein